MATVTTRYVIYATRRRRHGGGGVIDIQPSSTSVLVPGDTYQAPPGFPVIPWTDPQNNVHNLQFLFWSVAGGQNGTAMSFPGQPSPSVTVGGSNINATAWYIDPGGLPGDGTGIIIDAFDEMLGDFVFDDFVSVTPGNAAFNTNANWDGYVPTDVNRTITAFNSIHGVPFNLWKVLPAPVPGVNINGTIVIANQMTSGLAIAFYRSSDYTFGRPNVPMAFDPWWWIKTHGGLVPPPPNPWDKWMKQISIVFDLADTSRLVDKELGVELINSAVKHLGSVSNGLKKDLLSQQKSFTIKTGKNK